MLAEGEVFDALFYQEKCSLRTLRDVRAVMAFTVAAMAVSLPQEMVGIAGDCLGTLTGHGALPLHFESAREKAWEYVEEHGGVCAFDTPDLLAVRALICTLDPQDPEDWGDSLGFFIGLANSYGGQEQLIMAAIERQNGFACPECGSSEPQCNRLRRPS